MGTEVGAPAGTDAGAAAFDALDAQEAAALLLTCCAAPGWARRVAARRPLRTAERVLAAAEEELRAADETDVAAALAGHPRIGERSASAASGREQAAVLTAGARVLAELADANRAYEERFGHVYLVCASGRGADELLAVLRRRLGNDPATERGVLRAELTAITALRLRRALAALAGEGA